MAIWLKRTVLLMKLKSMPFGVQNGFEIWSDDDDDQQKEQKKSSSDQARTEPTSIHLTSCVLSKTINFMKLTLNSYVVWKG